MTTTPIDSGPIEVAGSEPWVPSLDSFGSRLALVRHRMNWNVKEAARECGLPAASWRTWEMDGGLPRNIITIAMTIATRTGCDYLWLVHGPNRGGVIRTLAYVEPRVLTRRDLSHGQPNGHLATTRPVRQTRPVVGAVNRPLTRVSM